MGQRPYRRYDVVLVDDCPVQPHVWREYGLRSVAGDDPDVPPPDPESLALELIAHVRDGVSPLIVLSNVRKWIPRRDGEQDTFVLYGQYFLADATFEQMVTAILPLTGWSVLLRRIGEHVTDEDLHLELRAARHPERGIVSEAVERLSQEDYGRLRWLLTQIVKFQPDMSSTELRAMVSRAIERAPDGIGPLVSVGYNRWVEPSVDESRKTIKADAAESLFDVDCSGVHWAVVDTGIDDTHPCFGPRDERGRSRVTHTYDVPRAISELRRRHADKLFVGIANDSEWEQFEEFARVDDADRQTRFQATTNDHGTHVAGILAGSCADPQRPDEWRGICPTMTLSDIRVFNDEGRSREFEVVIALAFVRWLNRRADEHSRIDGVNISLSIPFAVDNFACGWTPVCVECDRLVASGVVVVVAAGNSGFDDSRGAMSVGAGFRTVSIADPGNAEQVITVGATHRTDPHRYGPLSRSARGPTADGRHKPDLLAPGFEINGPVPGGGWDPKSGTSQAAPHVSGVAAMLIARYPELRGRPDRIKHLLCSTATDLERIPDFQGHGIVDALRALQAP